LNNYVAIAFFTAEAAEIAEFLLKIRKIFSAVSAFSAVKMKYDTVSHGRGEEECLEQSSWHLSTRNQPVCMACNDNILIRGDYAHAAG
jgi:hypothetical protein